MIGEIHEALRTMLQHEGKIPAGDIDITFAVPTREWASGISRPTLNFYLYDILENLKLRDMGFERLSAFPSETQRLHPRRIDLKYVITAHFKSQTAELEEQEWQVLWRVLATLMRNTDWPDQLLPQEVRSLDVPLSAQVANPETAPRPSELWSVLGTPPRPSINYVLTVPLDLNIEYLRTLVVGVNVGIRNTDSGEVVYSVERYGWVLRGPDGEGVAGAEVRLPDAPGLSFSDADGIFTTRLPHNEVSQLLVRLFGESNWQILGSVPGSVEITLPDEPLPNEPESDNPPAIKPQATKPQKKTK
ncbi:DUF4255 domain-containing protein (plasmid) [Deinococcus psychrotolerans]|uniref:DUF4255 domain-containing protein n=1 Tax=Deinococcus psychrotolerans TaxID=2489213 RepID=A0A3G8YGQ0_9DEIO|nr:DUF4255 domain-containing protein [Deinococcus psychrotolerans]AZI44509.1 DUF4255 domain-containing protein [Deinococcus psychrotolerans]